MTSLDTDQLNAFLRIVRDGSFSRAASSLHIGQPAISSRIQALESSVGGKLFHRGRRVTLTPFGETFLPYARRTLEVLSEGIEVTKLAKSGKRGRVCLGALGSLAERLVGPALDRFMRDHPEVKCVVRSGDHETMVDFLWDGIIELALIAWPCTEAFASELVPLLTLREPVVLVAHPKHPLAKRKTVTEAELVKLAQPLFLLRWWQNHHPEMIRLAQLSGKHVEIPKETARFLVKAKTGAGFFPETFIAAELACGELSEIRVHGVERLIRTCALASKRRSSALSPAAQLLIHSIKRQAQELKLL